MAETPSQRANREAETIAPPVSRMQAWVAPALPEAIERALVEGDLKGLTVEQRVQFYNRTCESLGLNPITRPFGYIVLNGKLTLYAQKNATDQLRDIHGISIIDLTEEERDGTYVVFAKATNAKGRSDADMGAVPIKGLQGEALCNARMKAITKAKRRVTLSLCGLGMLDELEVTTIPGARQVGENEPVIPTIRRPQAKEASDAGSHGDGSTRGDTLRLGSGGDPHGDRGDRPEPPGRDDRAVRAPQDEGVTNDERSSGHLALSGGDDRGRADREIIPDVAAPPVREPGADDGDVPPITDADDPDVYPSSAAGIPWPANRQQFKDPSTKLISHEQFKTLMVALREKVGKDADTRIKEKLTGMGILHRNEIPAIMYAGLVDWVERGAPPNAEATKQRIVRSRRR